MDDFRKKSLDIISNVGDARSHYIEAISYAKENNFDKAYDCMKKGINAFKRGHSVHCELVFNDSHNSSDDRLSLILIHAEDQLMSAEGFKIIATEFIDLYKRLYENQIFS